MNVSAAVLPADACLRARWCHLSMNRRPSCRQSDGVAALLPGSAHLPSLLGPYRSHRWRRWTNRLKMWFPQNRTFSRAVTHGALPFDGTIRFLLRNTISGRRDGEHIHLWTWSFKRRLLIWGDASADKRQDEKLRRRLPRLEVTPSRCGNRGIIVFLTLIRSEIADVESLFFSLSRLSELVWILVGDSNQEP